MVDTPCSEVVWRVLATHSFRQFPLHFPPPLRHRVPSHFSWSLRWCVGYMLRSEALLCDEEAPSLNTLSGRAWGTNDIIAMQLVNELSFYVYSETFERKKCIIKRSGVWKCSWKLVISGYARYWRYERNNVVTSEIACTPLKFCSYIFKGVAVILSRSSLSVKFTCLSLATRLFRN